MNGSRDVPAWVLVVVMTAGIVVGLAAAVGPVDFTEVQRVISGP